MSYFAKITTADNGFIVETLDDSSDEPRYVNTVFEATGGQSGLLGEPTKEHVVNMLYFLIDYFEESGSRYDKDRLHVGFVRGDKYEGPITQEMADDNNR